MSIRLRLEEDGLFLEPPEHWEMFEAAVYLYRYKQRNPYTIKSGEKKVCMASVLETRIRIPIDVVRHLKLKNRMKVMVAIRLKEE